MGIGRSARSSAWSPSRGVTSKSPMYAGAAERVNDGVVINPVREGRRAAADPGARRVRRWPVWSTRDRPRPAPRQRPGPAYGSVLLGDPPSFDEDDTDPHCCVKPLDAVALPSLAATAACRTRHGPTASCSAPMASRLRYLVTVYGPGCLPGHRDCLKHHDSLGFDAGRLLCPLVPREPSERLARPPPAVSDVHTAHERAPGASGSIRPRRPSNERRGASVPTRVHLPDATPPYSRIAALRIGTSASPATSYGCRACTGFPPAVWSPSLSGWLPTTPPQGGSHMGATIAPAPKRHQSNLLITLAATALQADLAHRHYRSPACSPGIRHRECDVPRRTRRVVTCASDRVAQEHYDAPDVGLVAGVDGALGAAPGERAQGAPPIDVRSRRCPPRRGSSNKTTVDPSTSGARRPDAPDYLSRCLSRFEASVSGA